MDSILFEEWVREVDRRFTKEGRKIVPLVDNGLAHPSIDNLVSTELIFLPPNTTLKLQPMDQGVIRSLKAHYKTMSIKKLIEAIDKKKPLREFSILDAMQMFDVLGERVQPKMLLTVLKKLKFQKKSNLKSCEMLVIPLKISKNIWISLPYITPSSS